MIDIKEALYNILHSRYGRDVRQSIHDGIYQINENANEAVQTAKAMGVGTDISSPTSSSTGYVAGNLYLNNSTWDLWQCIGTDSWVNKGNIKGETGVKGADGINYYIHIRYSDKYDGTGFTASPTASSEYMGVYYGTSQTAPTNKQDYQWTSYVGASGTSAYVHIMYSENADGTGFVSIPTPLCKYIGFYSGPLSSPPANKSYYTWSEYVGKSGTGSGDMTAAEYAPSGIYGKVDNAIKADNVGNADTSLLEKLSDNSGKLNYDGNDLMLEAAQFANQAKLGEFVVNRIGDNVKELALHDNITTKLSKVNNKIDKPTSATEGQVLTYRNNEWVADDSQGGGQFVIIAKGETYEGQTLTATKGIKSKSAVITSGVARIPVDEGGVWTLTLSNGETFNTPNMTYYGEYEVTLVPNGSTVTPTDDIQIWLKCAGLNKTYTTISQVLADTNTLSALISDNNASDYLARSTAWASDICNNESAMTYINLNDYCAWSLLDNDTWNEAICYSPYFEKVLNVHLDTLTSSSTEATAESYLAQYDDFPYTAFDGNESTGWWAHSTSLKDSFWLQYKSNKLANVIMKKAILFGNTGSTLLPPQDIVLYRNDDIPLCDAFKITDRAGDKKTTIIVFNNNKVGKSDTYKLITTCTPNGNVGGGYNGAFIYELQFYGRERA